MGFSGAPDAETDLAAFGSVGERIPLPCTQATHTYHSVMDTPTFEAQQRIMELIQPRMVRRLSYAKTGTASPPGCKTRQETSAISNCKMESEQ